MPYAVTIKRPPDFIPTTKYFEYLHNAAIHLREVANSGLLEKDAEVSLQSCTPPITCYVGGCTNTVEYAILKEWHPIKVEVQPGDFIRKVGDAHDYKKRSTGEVFHLCEAHYQMWNSLQLDLVPREVEK